MTPELLREQLLMPRDVESVVESDSEPMQELLFDAHDVSVMELISNWIFDKNTSAFSEDPNLIKLIIPADKFADTTKIQRVVCYIRYADAVRFLKEISGATWIDDQNEAVELSIGEAFSMTLYNSHITSIGNRDCNNGDVKDKWGFERGILLLLLEKLKTLNINSKGLLTLFNSFFLLILFIQFYKIILVSLD